MRRKVLVILVASFVIMSGGVFASKDWDVGNKKKGTHLWYNPVACTSNQPAPGQVTEGEKTLTSNVGSTGCVCVEPYPAGKKVKLESVSTTSAGCFSGGAQTISKKTCFPFKNIYWTLIPHDKILYKSYEKGGYSNSKECGAWGALDMR